MGAIKRNIPNFITCLNLACGCLGIIFLFQIKPMWAIYTMFIAAFFDFMDGLVARLLKVTSPIGKDLDSLADIVTFGVLPGFMMYKLLTVYTAHVRFMKGGTFMSTSIADVGLVQKFFQIAPYFAILIPVFSAIRLARFNNDSTQSYSFKGLPTPANGILIACIFGLMLAKVPDAGYALMLFEDSKIQNYVLPADIPNISIFVNPFFLLPIVILLSILMVVNLPLMAFKFKGFGWKANQWKYILLILCLPLAIFLGFASAPIILILYIILSQIHFRTKTHEI